MQISNEGVIFISNFEGFRNKPYLDVANIPTIGYGTTHYINGNPVTLNDSPIDKETALGLLKVHISNNVEPYIIKVFTSINQNQFDSLCSFAYNCGISALDKSSLKQAIITNSNPSIITACFLKWCMAGGKQVEGLKIRRQKEAELFLS